MNTKLCGQTVLSYDAAALAPECEPLVHTEMPRLSISSRDNTFTPSMNFSA